jgi:hypothetical protein
MTILNHFRSLLNSSQRRAFESTVIPKTLAVLVQGPPGTGKSFTLALMAIAYTLILHVKYLIVTPTNNAANEITDKIQSFWNSAKPPPCKGPPNIIRWLTPADEHSVYNILRPSGVPDAMSTISLVATVHRHIRSTAKDNIGSSIEQKEALEWINLWKNRDNLHQNEANRLRQLTCNWEMICQKEAHIAITTCDNTYTLNPDHFTASIIIVDECSQTIKPAMMLPVVRFLKNLRLIILAGDDEQLRPFVLSTSSENEFEKQLKKSWFERVRLSSVVPTITLTQ